jgi:AraC-like DNA-binding protein
MKANTTSYAWNGMPIDRQAWIGALSKRGWLCSLDASHFGRSSMDIGHAGQADIVNIDAAWQRLTPGVQRSIDPWEKEYLLVNAVKSGIMSIEQRGRTLTFGPGDVAVLDPQHIFTVSLREPTRFSALRVPKPAFRERGLRSSFPVVLHPNPASADVCAVRDVLLNLTSQGGKASEALLARLGGQCIDLFDVLIDSGDEPGSRRADAVTVRRAKQFIARGLGDPDLNVERIADGLHMSVSSLTRAFQATGLSTMRYVWSMRLEQAARRLLADASHGTIKKIAYQCGFASHAHFSRMFKARYQMTPREYAINQGRARDAETANKPEAD